MSEDSRVSLNPVQFGFLGIACLLVFSACGPSSDADIGRGEQGALQPGAVERTDSLSRIVSPANRRLVFDSFRGHFRLRGIRGETANLTLTKRGRGTNPAEARSVLEDIQITESGTADTYTFEMESSEAARSAVDVTGTVPRPVSLRIEQESGRVALHGVRGSITIRQRFGNVTIRDAADEVEISTETGDLAVEMNAVPSDGRMELRTANGDLHFAVPPGAPLRVDARTRAGEVRVQGLAFQQERLTPVDAGARYTAQIGRDGTVVDLRTENGIITLAAADTTAPSSESLSLPPPDTTRFDSLAPPPDSLQ